jgi:hypothetical protein
VTVNCCAAAGFAISSLICGAGKRCVWGGLRHVCGVSFDRW